MPTRTLVTASTPGADMTPCQMDYTARPLDVALQQDGWLAVQTADGGKGIPATVISSERHRAADDSGASGDGRSRSVDGAGRVRADHCGRRDDPALNPGDPANTVAPVGRLKLVKAEGNEVQRGDDGMFRLTRAAQATRGATLQADPTIRVMSGVLEGSNVKPVEAMTDMIASARRFEMQMKIISSVDENAGKANQLLAMS